MRWVMSACAGSWLCKGGGRAGGARGSNEQTLCWWLHQGESWALFGRRQGTLLDPDREEYWISISLFFWHTWAPLLSTSFWFHFSKLMFSGLTLHSLFINFILMMDDGYLLKGRSGMPLCLMQIWKKKWFLFFILNHYFPGKRCILEEWLTISHERIEIL